MTHLGKLPTWADKQHVYAVVETPRGRTTVQPGRTTMGARLNRVIIGFTALFGLALIGSLAPEPAAAQTAAQKRACGSDAKKYCRSSLGDQQQLMACMKQNSSRLSARCRKAMAS
jgi:hypothetical protein